MMTPPDKIYLQFHGSGDADDEADVSPGDVTWCQDRVFDSDIEYTRTPATEHSSAVPDREAVERAAERIFWEVCSHGRLKGAGLIQNAKAIARIITEELSR
jgi:hypothetical protein